MQDILDLHEAEVPEFKHEKERRKTATMRSLADLYELLNESDKANSEEEQEAAATETVAQV
jgi:hypothetical protein